MFDFDGFDTERRIDRYYVKQEPYINDEGIYVPCEDYAPEGQSVPYRCIMTKEMFVKAYKKWIEEK